MRQYHVYILASTQRCLYVGVTNDLRRRVWEHRQRKGDSFTARYRIDKLVHFETFTDVRMAIAREKTLKCWRRERKERLVTASNAGWLDLSADWLGTAPINAIDPGCSKTDDASS